jgi:acetyltransferase
VNDLDATLRDGRAVHIRAMVPGDEAELLQAFGRLDQDARYMRFMRFVSEPDVTRLRQVLASFPEQGIGIVATVPADDGIDIVGSAVAVFAPGQPICEFAITVASAFGGTGLATVLMRTLIDEATRRGMREMEGFVLATNRSMLRLAERLGFSITRDREDASVHVCRLKLAVP